MTNGKRFLSTTLFFAFSLGGFWLLSPQESPKSIPAAKSVQILARKEKADTPMKRKPGSVPSSIGNSVPFPRRSETSAPIWKKRVEETLVAQGGVNLKSATVESVDSFDWQVGKIKVPVESVLVKVEHAQGHRSSFRAIVDASTGKILQTWDHPVIDEFGHNSNHIKVDPRYHND